MKAKNLAPHQVEEFTRRVISSLPDSLEQRIADLEVLVAILPPANFGRVAAEDMLAGLLTSQRAQREFLFTNGGAK